MTRRIISALVQAARENWTDTSGHFHPATGGRAYPCTDPACTGRRH